MSEQNIYATHNQNGEIIQAGRDVLKVIASFIGDFLAFRRFEKRYLKWIADEHRYLKLIGIKREINRPKLEEIYVSLQGCSTFNSKRKIYNRPFYEFI